MTKSPPPGPTNRRFRALAFVPFLLVPGELRAQGGVPLGPEFRINTYTSDEQAVTSVASDSSGNFVVSWSSSNQDGSLSGIFGQRYSNTGVPLGGEFRVNTYTTGQQGFPAVASDSAGSFVVTWISYFQDGSGGGIFAQRYATTGAALGGEFLVNTYITGYQGMPSVASASAGNFVVTWDSYQQDGSARGVFAQRFASNGAALGGEFRVNTYTSQHQSRSSVASDSAGNFVVAWQSYAQDGSDLGIFAQRYSSTGLPLGGEFRVNTYTSSYQAWPSVACDSAGNFVVAWESVAQDGSTGGIFAQRYSSTGVPLGGEFRVNSYTTSEQRQPVVATDSAGNFVVAWQSPDGDGAGIFAQRYMSTGAPLGVEFRMNSSVVFNQRFPSLASDPAGHFVVVWQSETFPNGGLDVFGQRYGVIVPVELLDFTVR